jgi:hypothetical protein
MCLLSRLPYLTVLGADAGTAYALYFPAGGDVKIDLSGAKGEWVVHWIDIASGEWGAVQNVADGKTARLAPPGPGNWGAAIVPRE